MSLFGALMGDMDDDPMFGGHMRRMNQMMNSFFRDPFEGMLGGGMFGPSTDMMLAPPQQGRHRQNQMMPFGGGFPNIFDLASSSAAGGQFSTMTQVMTMTPGPDGRPQVYQASSSMRQGPDGVRETKKTVADSRTGVKKMSIGHHIYDRGHVVEREQNVYSGEKEEREEFINLDEDEAESFNKEWEDKTRNYRSQAAIGHRSSGGRRHRRDEMLALPPGPSTHERSSRLQRPGAGGGRRNRGEPVSKAAAIASKKRGEEEVKETGMKRSVEEDSDEEPPSRSRTKTLRKSDTEEITITELNSSDEDDDPVRVDNKPERKLK